MTGSDAASPGLRDMVAALCHEEAEFLIVGGFGGASNEQPHSGDIDILVRPAADNAARVWRALQRLGLPDAAAAVTENELASPGTVHRIGAPPQPLNVITDVHGMTFDQAWQSRVVVDWDGRRIGMLGYGALLASVRATRSRNGASIGPSKTDRTADEDRAPPPPPDPRPPDGSEA